MNALEAIAADLHARLVEQATDEDEMDEPTGDWRPQIFGEEDRDG